MDIRKGKLLLEHLKFDFVYYILEAGACQLKCLNALKKESMRMPQAKNFVTLGAIKCGQIGTNRMAYMPACGSV